MDFLELRILKELYRKFQIEGPDEEYHITTLAEILEVEHGELAVALTSLKEKGFIHSEWVGPLALLKLTSRGMRLVRNVEHGVGALPKPEVLENLPPPRTSRFIGRDHEKLRILDGFQSGIARILISGSGGVGKTTLALEIAHYCLKEKIFDAIIWTTAELGRQLTIAKILDTIAETLYYDDYKKLEQTDKVTSVLRLLRARRNLLIVDNFETVNDSEIETFLRELPGSTKLLLTSRHLSAVPEEELVSLKEMDEAEALELIKVKSVNKRLSKAPDEILQKLHKATGGMPLALEWAIGQINTGRQTLESVLDSLANVKADVVYTRLFDSSYKALTGIEKRILWALSIFIDSAPKSALKSLGEFDDDDLEMGLKLLIEMLLVHDNEEFEEAKVRYSIHPLLRNFAQKKLNQQPSNTADEFVKRFVRYFSDYVEKEIPSIIERKQIRERQFEVEIENIDEKMDWAEVELENISATMDRCYVLHDWERLIELVKALSYFYGTYGYWNERIRHGHQAVEACRISGDKKSEAWMYVNELGYIMISQGRYDEAEQLIRKGMEILAKEKKILEEQGKLEEDAREQKGIQFTIGLALRYLGIIYTKRSKYEAAEQFFERALEVFERLDRGSIIANQKTEMGELAYRRNNYELARRYYQETLEYHDKQKEGKTWVYSWMAKAYNGLGDIAYQQSLYDEARNFSTKGLECASLARCQKEIAYSKYRLANIEELERKYNLALQLAQESLHFFTQVGKREQMEDLEKMIERLVHVGEKF